MNTSIARQSNIQTSSKDKLGSIQQPSAGKQQPCQGTGYPEMASRGYKSGGAPAHIQLCGDRLAQLADRGTWLTGCKVLNNTFRLSKVLRFGDGGQLLQWLTLVLALFILPTRVQAEHLGAANPQTPVLTTDLNNSSLLEKLYPDLPFYLRGSNKTLDDYAREHGILLKSEDSWNTIQNGQGSTGKDILNGSNSQESQLDDSTIEDPVLGAEVSGQNGVSDDAISQLGPLELSED